MRLGLARVDAGARRTCVLKASGDETFAPGGNCQDGFGLGAAGAEGCARAGAAGRCGRGMALMVEGIRGRGAALFAGGACRRGVALTVRGICRRIGALFAGDAGDSFPQAAAGLVRRFRAPCRCRISAERVLSKPVSAGRRTVRGVCRTASSGCVGRTVREAAPPVQGRRACSTLPPPPAPSGWGR